MNLSLKKQMKVPTKHDCFYILEMVESNLIDFSYTQPWAEKYILSVDEAPLRLCDLSMKAYQGDIATVLREFIFDEPFEKELHEME